MMNHEPTLGHLHQVTPTPHTSLKILSLFICWLLIYSTACAATAKDLPPGYLSAADAGLTPHVKTDQAQALARAMKTVKSSKTFDTLYIPKGIYAVSQIHFIPGVNIIGEGAGKTILKRGSSDDYLAKGKNLDFAGTRISHLTLHNNQRTLLMNSIKNLTITDTEFHGGIVRFENSANIILERNTFNNNLGKGGYASSNCEKVRIVNNVFNSIENGSINLSGHTNCYVASNMVTAVTLIDSGYAGIRLPNRAMNNIVEHNTIINHGRGLFLLSSSENNIARHNTIKGTTHQGVLIQSSRNTLQHNRIEDAGKESIYVVHATSDSSPTPSTANHNRIIGNIISDTIRSASAMAPGLKIATSNNVVQSNTISQAYGRPFGSIKENANNSSIANRPVK